VLRSLKGHFTFGVKETLDLPKTELYLFIYLFYIYKQARPAQMRTLNIVTLLTIKSN